MKKLIVISLIIIALVLGYLGFVKSHQTSKLKDPSTLGVSSSIPRSSPQLTIENPQNISIPAINIEAVVESVGLDSKRNMDVPIKSEDVGWYNLGPKPGEVGNAVIDGHLDLSTGAPAVFYNLKKLRKGDQIIVTDAKNQKFTYQVRRIENYDYDKFPLNEVFGQTDKSQLNLITCFGVFDQKAKNYSQRTVVYSELVSN